MTHETPCPPERIRNLREIVITPGEKGTLYLSNHSDEANRRSNAWERNKAEGKLWIAVACGDARVMIPMPERIESLRSIAIGGERAIEILKNNGNQFAVVVSHIDGDTITPSRTENGIIIPGKMPTGCGGHAETAKLIKEKKEKIKGIHYYLVAKKIHPDPIIQAMSTARDIRDMSGKPSLAVIQDHRTGRIYPLAAFLKDYQIIPRELDEIDIKYDETKIYERGLPELKEAIIPEIFCEFLEASRAQYKKMLDLYPQLKEMQRVQNPRMIVISTKLPSLRIRYPDIADVPGIAFKLHMSREKEEGKISLKPETMQEIINQALYPIEHAVENASKFDLPFSQTDRILIETSDIRMSELFASKLSEEEWTQKWLALPDHKIIVVQSQHGVSNIIEEFKKAA